MEDEFLDHLRQPYHSVHNTVDDGQTRPDDEENFTDLRSCTIPIDTDSDCSRSSSPFDVRNDQPISISYSSNVQQNFIETNEDDDIPENDICQQPIATSCSCMSYHLKPSDDILKVIHNDPHKFIFTPIHKENNDYMQCRLIRDKSGLSQTFYLEVELTNNEKPICLLTAEKEMKTIGSSQYIISLNQNFIKNFYLAKLVCNNVIGTNYTLFSVNKDEQQELAAILYESNFLGLNGPRKVKVLLPKFNHQMPVLLGENEINQDCSEEQDDSFIRLYNKTPIFNEETCCYMLRFDGKNRVTIPSIKNFQIVVENKKHIEHVVMQFGRTSEDEFSCDFRYPLSLIQAFSIGLSACETRLFRE